MPRSVMVGMALCILTLAGVGAASALHPLGAIVALGGLMAVLVLILPPPPPRD